MIIYPLFIHIIPKYIGWSQNERHTFLRFSKYAMMVCAVSCLYLLIVPWVRAFPNFFILASSLGGLMGFISVALVFYYLNQVVVEDSNSKILTIKLLFRRGSI
jgi:hypothetical protein